jgi:hypothetical protein
MIAWCATGFPKPKTSKSVKATGYAAYVNSSWVRTERTRRDMVSRVSGSRSPAKPGSIPVAKSDARPASAAAWSRASGSGANPAGCTSPGPTS